MNKLFSKIAALSVGLAMAVGVGVAVGSQRGSKIARAEGKITTLAGITSGKNYYIGATVSSTDYYWKANGGTDVGTGLSGSSTTDSSEATVVSLIGSGSTWAIKLESGYYLSLASSKANGKYIVVENQADWTVSEVSSLLQFSINGYLLQKNSGTSLNFGSYASGQVNVWLEEAEAEDLGDLISIAVSGSMTKTSYTTAESWSPAGLTVTGTYENGSKEVTSQVSWTYDPASPADGVTSVTATAALSGKSASSSAQTVTVIVTHAGTAEDPFTVAEGIAKCKEIGTTAAGPWVVKGIISKKTAWDSGYPNVTYWISDDGTGEGDATKTIQCFRGKYLDGADVTASNEGEFAVGKIVTVTGNLVNYKGNTPEYAANNYPLSIEEPAATKYSVVSRINNGSLSVSEVYENTELKVSVVPELGYFYPSSLTFVRVAGSDVPYTYEDGVVTVEASRVTGNVVIEGTCVECNPIKSIYGIPAGFASGTVYGYYVGSTADGPVIMDGEYGVLLFKATVGEGWTAGETIVSASGTVDSYNGLGQIKSATVAEATGEYPAPAAPVTYAAKGGETREYANRLTTVTGTPTVTKGDITKDAGTADITLSFDLGGEKTVQVFYKKTAQTGEAYAALQAAVAGTSEITVSGFTGWYNGFQVQMSGYVAPEEGYTAEDFSQDLLDATESLCSAYVDGESDYDEYKTALQGIWSTLAGKYAPLDPEEKAILAEAERSESGTTIEQAMLRYDFLTGKYGLSEFINGRTPMHFAHINDLAGNMSENNTMIIIIAIASVTALAFTTLLVLKKRKHN